MSSTPGQNPYAVNPYAASAATLEPIFDSSDELSETIRRKYLNHEASLQTFGSILMFFAILIASIAVLAFLSALMSSTNPHEANQEPLIPILIGGTIFLGIAAIPYFVARGLWELNTLGQVGGTMLSAIGLLGFPLLTILNAYFLYLIWCEKGRYIFSSEYRAVVNATPHIKYKTPFLVKCLALMFAFLAMGAVIISFLTPFGP